MAIDRMGLAEFLRARRGALQPEDVGLPRGTRRRTAGLRREEVAELCHLSTDYYARLEQMRGPLPSETLIAGIAQGLRLSLDERTHLFRLAGHSPPSAASESAHVSPGLLRVLDRLADTPAEIVTELGVTLRQTPLAVTLMGDASRFSGPERSHGYRWFTDPRTRDSYAPGDHDTMSRMFVSGLRELVALRGPDSEAAHYARLLAPRSAEFRRLWESHEVGVRPADVKHFRHPEVGDIELNCQSLVDPGQSHHLLVYTATPGTRATTNCRCSPSRACTGSPRAWSPCRTVDARLVACRCGPRSPAGVGPLHVEPGIRPQREVGTRAPAAEHGVGGRRLVDAVLQ